MFKFFKRRQKKGDGVIALDMGSDVIKALLFTVEEKSAGAGEVPVRVAAIHHFAASPRRGEDPSAGAITDIASAIERGREVIKICSKESGVLPSRLVMGVSGESIKGGTIVETCDREDPKSKINLAELYNIIHRLEWHAFAETRREISSEMGYPEIDIKLIHAAIVDIKIDGYRVKNPLGFQGKKMEMTIFNAFAPLGYSDALQNIADQLELEKIGILPQAYALSRAVDPEHFPDVLLLNVGAGGTDIALVKKGALIGTKMFGVGGGTFTRRLAVELNVALKEAENLKIAYSEDHLEAKSKKILADTLESDIEVWLEGMVLALSEFRQVDELPSRILLTGGGSRLPEIKEALSKRKWHKKLHFREKPEAVFMKSGDLIGLKDAQKIIENPARLPVASLAATALELTGEETVTDKALRKVIGIMKV